MRVLDNSDEDDPNKVIIPRASSAANAEDENALAQSIKERKAKKECLLNFQSTSLQMLSGLSEETYRDLLLDEKLLRKYGKKILVHENR